MEWLVFLRALSRLAMASISLVALFLCWRSIPESSQWADAAKAGLMFAWAWLNRIEDAIDDAAKAAKS